MIDTVVLTLNEGQFKITNHDRFTPSTKGIFEYPYYPLKGNSYFKCTQNPTQKDYRTEAYRPRLTVIKRWETGGISINLKIEFSAPKLVCGNNFMELKDSDFQAIVEILKTRLQDMGVLTSSTILRNAKVSAIHYSKNIILDKHTSLFMVMNELKKMNCNKRLDLSETTYINEGYALRCHSNSFEIALYDKVKDLEQAQISEKRAVERDYTPQMSLFAKPSNPMDVLRIEIRLRKPKILKVLGKIGQSSKTLQNLTFERLFSSNISKSIVGYYWAELTKGMPLISFNTGNLEELYSKVASYTKGNVGSKLQALATIVLIDSIGARPFRALTSIPAQAWQRQRKKIEGIKDKVSPKYLAVKEIENSLKEFRPLTFDDYKRLGFNLAEKKFL